MASVPLIVLASPRLAQAQLLDEQIVAAYHQWRSGWEAQHPVRPIENVRFEHDPGWRRRFWSLQNAHDGNTFFWKATRVICAITFGV